MKGLRWILVGVPLLLAACGGGSRPAPAGNLSIEQSVKSTLERGLMTSQPRGVGGSSWSTHVRRVRCATRSAHEFSCEVTFMDGSRRHVIARERTNGLVAIR